MKNLIFVALGMLVNIPFSYSQTPHSFPDNLGSGNAMDFDGTGDYVSMSDPNWTLNDFTVECWFYLDKHDRSQGSGYRTYLLDSRGDGSQTNRSFSLIIDSVPGGSGDIEIHHQVDWPSGGWSEFQHTISDPAGGWHHTALLRKGTTLEIYLDGVFLSNTATQPGSLPVKNDVLNIDSDWRIGDFYSSGFYPINGKIDEVRVWNVARTQVQIRDDMCRSLQGNETGLIGYWNMNDASSSSDLNVMDNTGNGNNGTRQ